MFESIINFFKKMGKKEQQTVKSKDAAKERLHLVLMQDRANVSADFLDLMKQEIIEVIKKYIDVDENAIDVRLTNKANSDGTTSAPALYANIPIVSIKEEVKNKMARQNDAKAEHIIPDKKEEENENSNEKVNEIEQEEKEDVKSSDVQDSSEENKQEENKEELEKEQKDENSEETINEVKENAETWNKKEEVAENISEEIIKGEACEKKNS